MDDLPIIDAHHHFWDLALRQHPALIGAVDAGHRYGDITPICKNFRPADYLRECAGHNVVKTVHMEAEWNPRDPVDRLCNSFDEIFSAFKAVAAELSADERRMLFHDTAARIYRPA